MDYSTHEINGTVFGDTVAYTCVTGYEVQSGSAVRKCQANKQWSGDAPVCDSMYTMILQFNLKSCHSKIQEWLSKDLFVV